MTAAPLTLADRARIVEQYEQIMRDKSYQELPMGQYVAEFLRLSRKRYSDNTLDAYESTLDKFARAFGHLELADFEPPIGTQRIEEFLDREWGKAKPATYNRHRATVGAFFKHQRVRGRMQGDPTLVVDRAKKRESYRETFAPDQVRAIIAGQAELRDKLVLRLILQYGLRGGGVRAIQFKHFDHLRKRLTVFLKGGKVRQLPIPDPAFWHDLERVILESGAASTHYLMQARWANRHGGTNKPEQPMSRNGFHKWWYARLAEAGIVPAGTTSGEKPHKGRHTAGQAVLDHTGNLKAVQKLLGHASIQTTADTYTDWDIDQLEATLADVYREDEE